MIYLKKMKMISTLKNINKNRIIYKLFIRKILLIKCLKLWEINHYNKNKSN